MVETVLSAIASGDVGALQRAVFFDATTRVKAEALFASLSPETRATYGTPEGMIATLMATTNPAAGMQIMGERWIDADHQILRVQTQYYDGRVRENEFNVQRADDGWQYVFPAALLDKFTAEAGRSRSPTPDSSKPSTGGKSDRGAALVGK